jgi:TolB-like protein
MKPPALFAFEARMRWTTLALPFLLCTLVRSAPVLCAENKVKLAVLDLKAVGVDAPLASGATSLLASELVKLDVFRVISRDDIRSMLAFEKERQALGGEADSGTLTEIGEALGVDYTVAGSLAKVGTGFVLTQTQSNTKSAQVENRVTENIAQQEQIVGAVARDARKLVSKLLAGRQGFLVVTTAERGASVKIDGLIYGNTPLPGRIAVSWGPHLLEVEKTGFIAYSEDISVPDKQVLAKSVSLVPSTDYISSYESRAIKMRDGAWIASGATVVAIGLAVLFNQLSSGSESTFQSERASYEAGNSAVTLAQLSSLSQKGSNQVLVARIALGAAVVGAGFATWFWVWGDDPDKYRAFHDAPALSAPAASTPASPAASPAAPAKRASLSLGALPLSGGGALALQGSF